MLAVGLGCAAMVVNAPAASASPHDGGRAAQVGHGADARAQFRYQRLPTGHDVAPSPRYTPPAPRWTPPVTHYTPPVTHYTPPATRWTPPVSHYAPPATQWTPPAPPHAPPVTHYTPPAPRWTPPVAHDVPPAPHAEAAFPSHAEVPAVPSTPVTATHAASEGDSHNPPGWARSALRSDPARMWRNGNNGEARLRRQSHSSRTVDMHSSVTANFTPLTVKTTVTTTAKPAKADITTTAKPAKADITTTAKPAKADITTTAKPATTGRRTPVSAPATTVAQRAGTAPLQPVVTITIPPSTQATVVRPVVDYRPSPVVTVPAHRPSEPARPAVKPAAPRQTFPGAFGEPMVLARGAWQGLSLQAATDLKVPISLLVVVGVFLLIQALVDRRDPKVAAAPEHGTDDTVGFQ